MPSYCVFFVSPNVRKAKFTLLLSMFRLIFEIVLRCPCSRNFTIQSKNIRILQYYLPNLPQNLVPSDDCQRGSVSVLMLNTVAELK